MKADWSKPGQLLTLSPYSPLPPITGGTKRIFYLNRGYARAGWDVTQVCGAAVREGLRDLLRRRESVIEPGYSDRIFVNPPLLLGNRLLRHWNAPQVAGALLPDFIAIPSVVKRALARHKVVMLEHPQAFSMAEPSLRDDHLVVLDAHNIEYKIFEAERAERGIRGHAARTLYELERRCFARADLVFCCSEDDRRIAMAEFGIAADRIHVAPNGVDLESTPLVSDEEREGAKLALGLAGRTTAVFVGSRWPPNTEAVGAIAELAARRKDITFIVVGAAGEPYTDRANENFIVTGFVRDARQWYAAADVAVNPMLSGSGSNIKMFEYLAMGMPTVTTPFGSRGVDDSAGAAVVRAELAEIPDAINRVVLGPDLAQRRALARQVAEANYDWTAIAARISAAILAHCKARGG